MELFKSIAEVVGSAAEWAAAIISIIAIAVSVRSDRQRRRFETAQQTEQERFQEKQQERHEKADMRIRRLESALRTQEFARQKLLADLEGLRQHLGRVFAAFEDLIKQSLRGTNDDVIDAVRKVLPSLTALQEFIDGNSVILKSRHARELRELERFLIEIFLDVSRGHEVRRTPQYQMAMARYLARLNRLTERAKWVLDCIFSGRSPWRAWAIRKRPVSDVESLA